MRKVDTRLAKMILDEMSVRYRETVARKLNVPVENLAFKFHSGQVIHEPLEPAGEKFKISMVIEVHRRAGAPEPAIESVTELHPRTDEVEAKIITPEVPTEKLPTPKRTKVKLKDALSDEEKS